MTVTISANNSTVTEPNGSSILITGTGDTVNTNSSTITLSANISANINGSSDTIVVTTGDVLGITGVASGSVDTVSGSGASVTVAANSSVNFNGNNSVIASNATLGLNSGAITLGGSGDTINFNSLGGALNLSGTGASETIYAWVASTASAATGSPDVINASGDTLSIVDYTGTSSSRYYSAVTVNGNNDTLTLINNAYDTMALQINGNNDTLSINSNNPSALTTVTISGTGDTVTASNSTVSLTANSYATVSGGNNTIFVVAGDTLAINGAISGNAGSDTVSGNGASITVAANNSVLVNGNDTVTASNATLSLNVYNSMTLSGSGDTINLFLGNTLSLSGPGVSETIYEWYSTTSSAATGNPTIINASGDTLNIVDYAGTSSSTYYSAVTVNGNNDTLALTNNAYDRMAFQINGNNNTLSINSSNPNALTTVTISGTGDTVTASGSTVSLTANSSATVSGGNNTIFVVAGDTLAINGAISGNAGSDTVSGNGASITVAANNSVLVNGNDTVTASNATLSLNVYNSMTLSGSGDTINLFLGNTLSLSGPSVSETIYEWYSTTSSAATGNPTIINASGDTLNIVDYAGTSSSTYYSAVTVNGNNDTLALTNNAYDRMAFQINGNNNTLSINSSNPNALTTVTISGTGDTVTASGSTVSLTANSSATVSGANDAINVAAGDTLTVSGTTSGNVDTVNGSGASITVVANNYVTITGANEDVQVSGSGASITLGGANDIFQASSGLSARISATSGSVNVNDIETIVFGNTANSVSIANGSGTITVVGVASVTPAIKGMTGNNALLGTTGNDIFDGLGGTDTEQGNGGDDAYVFRKGYGNLTINNYSSANSNSLGTLSFDSSIAPGDVTIARGGVNFGDLILTFPTSGDQVTVSGAFAASTSGLRQVLFANGTSWNMNYLAANAGYDVNINGSTSTINASGVLIQVPANNATTTVNGSNDTISISGTGDAVVVNGSNDAVTTVNATAITVTGTASSATITGSGDALSITGASDTVTLNGTGHSVTVTGTNDTLTTNNPTMVTVTGAGSSATVNGNGNTLSITGASDAVTLIGNNEVVTVAGTNDALVVSGTGETITTSNAATVTVTGTGSSATVNGNGNTLSITGASDAVTLIGNNEAVAITGTGDALVFSGTGETITTSNAATVTVTGTGSSATINGNGNAVAVTGANDTVTLTGTGNSVAVTSTNNTITTSNPTTVTVSGNGSSAAINGNGNAVSVTGANDAITLTGTGDAVTISGTNDTITTSSPTTITLVGNSSAIINGVAITNSSGSQTVTSGNAPTITGTIAGQATTSEAPLNPFSDVSIGDINYGGTDTLTITQTGAGTLSGAGLSGGAGGIYTLTGTAASITSQLAGLTFTPVNGVANTSVTTSFTLSDKSNTYATATVNATTTVIDTDPAVAPTITGAVGGQATTSEAASNPFSGVVITDANYGGTDTLTITQSGAGTLSGSGLSGGASGVYTLTGTASAITSQLAALTFTPVDGVANTSVTTSFTLSDKSSAYATATVNANTTVVDTDPAVAPTITGTISGQATTSEAVSTPFSGVTVGDANYGGTDVLTITSSGGGTLSGTGLSGSNGTYTLSGTAASITSQLAALIFTPVNGVANTSVTTSFTLSDQSSAYATATVNSATSVIDTDPAVAPTITGAVGSQATTSEAVSTPFSGVTIGDANYGGTDVLTITLSGGGTLSGTGLSGSNGTYTLSGTAASITSQLAALTFTPVNGVANTSVTTSFTLSDQSSAYATATMNSATTVIDTDPAVAPTIKGTIGSQTTTSEAASNPFSGVTITDANYGGTDTLTITQSGAGTLSGSGLSGGAGGVYTLSGTAASITSQLAALTFTPVNGVANTSLTTSFTLSDQSSAYATATVDTTTTVIDIDPAVAPTITGAVGSQATTSEATLKPFTGVTIGDANFGGTETLTITRSGPGTLSGTGLSGGVGGVYTLTGTAAQVTSELDALTFKPVDGVANTSVTTSFTLSDKSSAYATPTVNATTTVIDTDPAVAPVITGAIAGQRTTSEASIKPFAHVKITDANSGGTEVLTITQSGTGTLSGAGLSGSNGTYTLSGTAAAITSQLDALTFVPVDGVANTSVTTGFTLSDKSSAYATPTVNTTTTVIDMDPAVPPMIIGTVSGQTTTSEAPIAPFSSVTIIDTNSGATDILTITQSGAGILSGTGLSGGANGIYTLSGTAAVITSELDALSFTPVNGVANTNVATTFGLSDTSSAYTPFPVVSSLTVIDTDPAVDPTISGTVAGQMTLADASIAPFTAVTITDPNYGASDTLTITLNGSGTLSGTGLSGSDGTYTLYDTAANVTSELQSLVFTPATSEPGSTTTTTFTLTDISSGNGNPVLDSTTSVVDTNPSSSGGGSSTPFNTTTVTNSAGVVTQTVNVAPDGSTVQNDFSGIAGQDYLTDTIAFNPSGFATSEQTFAANGIQTSNTLYGSDGSVTTDAFAFDPGTTTVGFQENAAGTSGALTLTSGGQTLAIVLFGQYSASGFALGSDNASGSQITYTPPAHPLLAS